MNILVDVIPLEGLATGISRYVRNLYLEMERISGVRVHYFSGHSSAQVMPVNVKSETWLRNTSWQRKLPEVVAFGLRSIGWLSYEHKLRRFVRANEYHVYHETNYVVSAMKDVPQVFTIYDLSLLKYRDRHPRSRTWFSDLFFRRRMKYAAHIITISDYIRSEVCRELLIGQEKVTAVPLAPSPFFYPRDPVKVRAVIRDLGLPDAYFLFVGTLEPRKNLSFLVRAAEACKVSVPIVLTGWDGWGDDILKTVQGLGIENKVFTTGYVDEETLACLYCNALAFVFPSLYEGFGLPVLEAMACGCPVICSNAASLPEVAGDAALLIDPHRVQDLVEAMDRVAGDPGFREYLSGKGFLRAAKFTWEKAARQTLAVFESVTSRGSP